MSHPIGCIMTGKNRVQGQCDAPACNYPFCEAREPEPAIVATAEFRDHAGLPGGTFDYPGDKK